MEMARRLQERERAEFEGTDTATLEMLAEYAPVRTRTGAGSWPVSRGRVTPKKKTRRGGK